MQDNGKIYNMSRLSIVLSVLLLVSCELSHEEVYKAPEFKNVKKLQQLEFLTDDLGFNLVNDIFKYNDCLYIVAYDVKSKTYLHAYDANTGEKIESAINYGNGPGELIYPGISYFDYDTGHLFFYDKVRQISVEYSLTDGVSLIETKSTSDTPWTTHSFPIDGLGEITMTSARIGQDGEREPRITIYDDKHAIKFQYDCFPIENELQYIVYQRDRADVSVDKKHLVVGTSYGSILEIFDISDGLQVKKIKYFVEPTLILRDGNYNNDDTILGFNDVFASDKFIYAAYDGENYGSVPVNDFFNNIAVFDYKGNPISLLRLNNTVERICIDEKIHKVYCVLTLRTGEVKIASFNISDV